MFHLLRLGSRTSFRAEPVFRPLPDSVNSLQSISTGVLSSVGIRDLNAV